MVSVVDALGSRVTNDLEISKTGRLGSSEVELVFVSTKRAEVLEWLDEYFTSRPDEFVVIGGPRHPEPPALTGPCRTSTSVFSEQHTVSA